MIAHPIELGENPVRRLLDRIDGPLMTHKVAGHDMVSLSLSRGERNLLADILNRELKRQKE